MAHFRLTTPHFIEPDYFKAGQIVDIQGGVHSLTPMMEPLDAEAAKLMDEYYKKNPKATISPVDDLPRTMAVAVEEPAPKQVIPIVKGSK